ncbi:hypothetical protein LOD99_1337 [Oopsacas minuta]|uniref:Uncharacterized protein n=1 Tax=Oopsacas minuta TaxID=111878 RepID=A0AAV7K5G3_9METZ|nr:hypothetical protein LOD99_1337 [Oopsacas minuta]
MSYEENINSWYQNEDAIIEMSDLADFGSTVQQFQNPCPSGDNFQQLKRDVIDAKLLEKYAEPFQNMFTESPSSKTEHKPSIFKPQSPWEGESYHLENFIPFLTKPKKQKLYNIPGQIYPTNSDSMDTQTDSDMLDRDSNVNTEHQQILNSQNEPDFVCEEQQTLSPLEKANFDFLKESLTAKNEELEELARNEMLIGEEPIRRKPQLYPGYKPEISFLDKITNKDGEIKKLPETDLTSSQSYNRIHTQLLVQQFCDLAKGERENNKQILDLQKYCEDNYSKSHPFHKDLTSTITHSVNILAKCRNAIANTLAIEKHGLMIEQMLEDKGIIKPDK